MLCEKREFMKLAYEIEIAPEEIETLVKMITSLIKEFIAEVSKSVQE